MAAKYDLIEELAAISGMQRVPTMTCEQFSLMRKTGQRGISVSGGHQRHRSDEEYCTLATTAPPDGGANAVQISDEQQRRSFRLRWSGSESDK
ncbi:unnamed protein product [Gongylonema pulchrum]|uniref:Oxidoreductase n=1 Tax=Gongylonema pulchrum TaxID=637853 RepID=A0A183DHL2_9BILA|nr:unnamed protein product [Gongylonema pulchrum]